MSRNDVELKQKRLIQNSQLLATYPTSSGANSDKKSKDSFAAETQELQSERPHIWILNGRRKIAPYKRATSSTITNKWSSMDNKSHIWESFQTAFKCLLLNKNSRTPTSERSKQKAKSNWQKQGKYIHTHTHTQITERAMTGYCKHKTIREHEKGLEIEKLWQPKQKIQ